MAQVSLNTRISPATDAALRKYCESKGVSIATVTDAAILYFLANKKEESK